MCDFTVSGQLVRGKRLGTELGFPTANLTYQMIADAPANGVYIAEALLDGKRYVGVLNQGTHPTAPEGPPTIETYLLDYTGGDLYGHSITLTYRRYLRPERRFDSLDALKAQLRADEQAARQWIKEHGMNPIEIKDASYRYEEDGKQAVDHVTMEIAKGSFVAVLGHNGSGKSTLAKLMNGLYLPSEGQVLVCGMDTATEDHIWELRKHAGMVFQNPDNQIVATVVREDVAFGLENLGVPQPDMLPRIDEALRAVGMTEFAAAAPHMLSGGQKQRVAVAGVLAMEPDVMILDEATAMLDPAGRQDVFNTVRKLNRDKGITVVWITHFMEEAARADRVVVLHHGAIAMDGTPREVFSQVERVKELGLDVPPMAELAQELRDAGMTLPAGILTVDDMRKELMACLSGSST